MFAIRGRWSAVTLAFAGALLMLVMCGAPPARSANLLWVGGTSGTLGDFVPDDLFGDPQLFLHGAYRDDDLVVIDYPAAFWPVTGPFDMTLGASVHTGAAALTSRAIATPGPLVVAGVSQGAMVAQQVQAALHADPAVASDTTFILIGNPNPGLFSGVHGHYVPGLDYVPRPLPETRFNTIVVVNEYDAWADPIARPWNLLTVLNSVLAMAYVHPFAHQSDLSAVPPSHVTTTINGQGGTTTTYLVPTEKLPLTMPLRPFVPGRVVDAVDDVLRPIVDAGYDRPAGTGSSRAAPPASARPSKPVRATASARTADSSSRPVAAGRSGRR